MTEAGPTKHPALDRLFTVGEVAELMRVSTMTVYRLIRAGELGAIRVGKSYRIRQRDVDGYVAERTVRGEPRTP